MKLLAERQTNRQHIKKHQVKYKLLDRCNNTYTCKPQGQYWAGRTPPPNNPPPNMAAANFVVITNGEGCVLNGTAVAAVLIDQ